MNLFGLFGGHRRRGYGLGHGFGFGSGRRTSSRRGYFAGGSGLLGLILGGLSLRRHFRNRSSNQYV